jgi:hypothetical protein
MNSQLTSVSVPRSEVQIACSQQLSAVHDIFQRGQGRARLPEILHDFAGSRFEDVRK